MAKKKGSFLGKLIGFIVFLAIVYIVLAVLDFLGVFVMGTYKTKEVLGVSIKIELGFNGETQDEDTTWRAYGNKIYFYQDGKEVAKGTIQNGVITYQLLGVEGADVNYFKDGDTDRKADKKGFVDYLRYILQPATKLIGKIVD